MHQATDDGVGGGDSTGIENLETTTKTALLTMDNPTGTPNKTVNWTLRVRAKYATSTDYTLTVLVKEGGTTRATLVLDTALTTSDATYEESWDPSSVSNADNLDFDVAAAGGAPSGTVHMADFELEIDDTPVTAKVNRLPLLGVS